MYENYKQHKQLKQRTNYKTQSFTRVSFDTMLRLHSSCIQWIDTPLQPYLVSLTAVVFVVVVAVVSCLGQSGQMGNALRLQGYNGKATKRKMLCY